MLTAIHTMGHLIYLTLEVFLFSALFGDYSHETQVSSCSLFILKTLYLLIFQWRPLSPRPGLAFGQSLCVTTCPFLLIRKMHDNVHCSRLLSQVLSTLKISPCHCPSELPQICAPLGGINIICSNICKWSLNFLFFISQKAIGTRLEIKITVMGVGNIYTCTTLLCNLV